MKTKITPSAHVNQDAKNGIGQTTPTNRVKYLAEITMPDNAQEESLRFRALFHESPVGIAFHRMIFDNDGKPVDYLFLDVNERFIELTGVDPRGQLVTEAFPGIEVDPANWIKTYGDVVVTGNSIRFSQYLENDKRWYDCMATSYMPNHFLVTFVDITESKKTKKQIQDVATFFQTIIENAPDGIALIDASGKFNYISASGRRMFGYTDDEQILTNPAESTHPDDLELVLSHLMRVMADSNYIPTLEYRFAAKDGHWIWIETTFRNLLHDPNVVSIIMNFRDITQQKLDDLVIREKDVQYRNLANSSPALIWTSDTSKLCNYFNSTWLHFTGRTLEQEMGNGWIEGVHPEDIDNCLTTYLTAFEKQDSFDMEYRLKHVSGNYRWILDIGTPNYNSEGVFIGYIGNCFDITERKEIENQLRLSEIKFRNTFEYSVVAKSLTTIEGNVNVNNAFCNLLGYSNEELSEMNWREFTHLDDIANNELISKSILDGKIDSANWLKRYIHKDGHTIWANITTILLRDKDGKPDHFVTELYDISAQKKAEEALKQSEELFKKAFTTSPDGISITRLSDGLYVKISDGSSKIFGYSVDDIDGKTSFDINIWVDINDRNKWIQLLTENGTVTNFETRFRRKDNEIIYALVSASIIELNGVKHVLSVTRDITERKIAEQRLAVSELFFRQSQEAAKIGSYNLDIATGLWTSSEVLDSIFGIDQNYTRDIEGWATIIDESDRNMMTDYFSKYVLAQKRRFNKEYRIVRQADGQLLWVHGLGELIIENGEIISMVGTIQDITNRKESELELQANMENLQRFHRVSVGRELSMIELKKEINDLLSKLGQPPKYKIID